MRPSVTRLAPSPTGALHLGNARTFLATWAIARTRGWRLILRVEDLDGLRIKPDAVEGILDTLRFLGIDWDGEPLIQSHDLAPSRASLRLLVERGLAYRCDLSRAEIEAASSAPHAGDREVVHPRRLRPGRDDRDRWVFEPDDGANYRFVTPDREVIIDDAVQGRTTHRPAEEIGDFVIWTRRGTPAYQLAVVVDDARQGVTEVIRGDDLLPSAARQTLLYEAMSLQPPRWCHLPLVVGEDGRRLAKRHGDTRISFYRDRGVTTERIIGLLAWWCGVMPDRAELSAAEFARSFSLDTLPRSPVTFREADHAWLLSGSSPSRASSSH